MDDGDIPPFVLNDTSYDESIDDAPRSDRSLKLRLPVIVKPICLANNLYNENYDAV